MSAASNERAPTPRRGTCQDCKRQIEILVQDDGTMIKLDTEVRSAVPWPGGREVQTVRLLHAGVCRPRPITERQRRDAARKK